MPDSDASKAMQATDRVETGGWVLHTLPGFRTAARALDLSNHTRIDELLRGAETLHRGRGECGILRLTQAGPRLHLRVLRHGGLLANVLGIRFGGLSRPLSELSVNWRLRVAGAPVPDPAFVLGRRQGWFWEAVVATVLEEHTLDGENYLRAHADAENIVRAIVATGCAVRRLHDAGCRHADLHIRNLLVRQDETSTEIVIVDLDRARIVETMTPRRRMHELMRLQRSLVKRGLEKRLPSSAAETFFDAYTTDDTGLRRRMLRFLRQERLRIAAHALFYRRSFE